MFFEDGIRYAALMSYKMKRGQFIASLSAAAAIPSTAGASQPLPREIAGIRIPDSSLAQEATNLARAAEPPEIFNHSLRTFLFAELIGQAKQIRHDLEMVYVASILHDTGLSPRYMSAERRFEVDGANLAREVLNRHNISGSSAELVWDAIALHDSGGIAQWKQAEVRLVNAGVGADFGSYLSSLRRSDIIAVLQAAPRTGFIDAFLNAVAVVAARKPEATGNCFVTDVGYRRVPGFHLENFCDAVKDDPFTSYGA